MFIVLKNFLLPLVFLVVPSAAISSTVDINFNSNGERYRSDHGMREDTSTRGRDLAGMLVKASYIDGTVETITWNHTRGAWGQSTGSNFNMRFGWAAFELSVTKTLASLSMDTRAANAVFDIHRSTLPGDNTYGTKFGFAFHVVGDDDPDGAIGVNYSQSFFLAGHERATDAYTRMSIDFSGLDGGGLSSNLQFSTDLDSLAISGDLTPVPLPASLLMFASAFGIMGAGVHRKRAT